jgi:hypothetical protein
VAFEQRDNSGSLFVNNRKQQDNHPDRTGKAMIGGVMYYVNGWLKKTKDGETWLSLAFKPVDGQQKPAQQQQQTEYNPTFPSDSGEVPF